MLEFIKLLESMARFGPAKLYFSHSFAISITQPDHIYNSQQLFKADN